MAKAFFKKNNIEYTEYNVAADATKRGEMVEKSGQMGVPVIEIDNQIVVGYDQKLISNLLGLTA